MHSSRLIQNRARKRLENAPLSESQDCDPITFCTSEGWSPAVLAVLLHACDPERHVRIKLLEYEVDQTVNENTRAEVFLELLATGRSLLEDRPEATPPMMPQRFHYFAESLACYIIDEFARFCTIGGADRVAYRILHTTLCVACRLNRHHVAKHLLKTGLCDPRCRFLHPVECRPLHIATSCGFGFLAQLLLEYRADPHEGDENNEMPVYKLTRHYEHTVSELQARVCELEGQLQQVRTAQGISDMAMELNTGSGSSVRLLSQSWPQRLSPDISRIDSILHDSRM